MLQEMMKIVSKKGIMEYIKEEIINDNELKDLVAKEFGYDKYEEKVSFPYVQGILLMLAPLMV
jgi:hypothetical protein